MMSKHRRQRGIVLVVSLLMIAVLALLATASINLGSGSALIVSNQRANQATQAAADAVVEETINDLHTLENRVALPEETRNGITVSRDEPVCIAFTPVDGFSIGQMVPQYNYLRFTVDAEEASSGARSRVRVGVRVLQPPGTC